jgi:Flp pilus assembly pilin Flp
MSFFNNENGVTAVEYGLLAGFWMAIISTVYATAAASLNTVMGIIFSAL